MTDARTDNDLDARVARAKQDLPQAFEFAKEKKVGILTINVTKDSIVAHAGDNRPVSIKRRGKLLARACAEAVCEAVLAAVEHSDDN